MPFRPLRLAPLALLGAALAAPVAAESLASSASSAGSASSGSVSDSLQGSSNSSSPDRKVAAGEYRIDAMTAVAEKPGFLRLHLTHVTRPGTELLLDLPEKTATLAALGVGERVAARQRVYGIEFATTPAREPFFLVLADDWHRELASNPVRL
ncbi:MAG: hypothetical protein KF788_17680 [Piscinibacter sp.]|nr:hypothetical protein [Piscinibacter sp.]